jgi:hypothetical protein
LEPQIALDRDIWVKVGVAAVATGALLWLATAAILLLAPAPYQCPDWSLRHGSSLWETLWFWGFPINATGCWLAVRWKWFIQKVIESDSLEMPATHAFARLCVMNSVAAELPLVLLLSTCF